MNQETENKESISPKSIPEVEAKRIGIEIELYRVLVTISEMGSTEEIIKNAKDYFWRFCSQRGLDPLRTCTLLQIMFRSNYDNPNSLQKYDQYQNLIRDFDVVNTIRNEQEGVPREILNDIGREYYPNLEDDELSEFLDIDKIIRLNEIGERVFDYKQSLDIDWNMLFKVLRSQLDGLKLIAFPEYDEIVPMTREEIVEKCLEFYKSLGEDIYSLVYEALVTGKRKLRVNIFNIDSVDETEFEKKDDYGNKKYSKGPSVQTNLRGTTLNMPLNGNLSESERKRNSQEANFDDIIKLVHEVGHLLDLNLDEKNNTITRELLGESTAFAFEILFIKYLLEHTDYPEERIKSYFKLLINSKFFDCRNVIAKLRLARIREEKGVIILPDIRKAAEEENISVDLLEEIVQNVLTIPRTMNYESRYALSLLISPTIVLKFAEKDGSKILKQYLEACKNDDWKGAISALGINPDISCLPEFLKNRDEIIYQIMNYRRKSNEIKKQELQNSKDIHEIP